MLNSKLKKDALETLKRFSKEYSRQGQSVSDAAVNLFEIRKSASKIVENVQSYINSLANAPKDFHTTVAKICIQLKQFHDAADLQRQSTTAHTVSGSVAAGGALMGAGIAAFGPTAAVAIATTFGTASTGTAISALSGAAATNAALAWIGGGALAAGGGGMAVGEAILAAAGPIGWVVGGLAVTGGAFYINQKNKKIAEKARTSAIEVKKQTEILHTLNTEIHEVLTLTEQQLRGIITLLKNLKDSAPEDYDLFSEKQKYDIGSLVNNTLSLSRLLNQKVGKL